jgi:hypothetical protein
MIARRVMSKAGQRLRPPSASAVGAGRIGAGRMRESPNKQLVETYLDGFRTNDHAKILSCLSEDIRWTVFGHF